MAELSPDRQIAWHVLGAVLRALRDRLPVDLSIPLGSQLPLLVRGTYYDQWQPERQPNEARSFDGFLKEVARGLASIRPVNSRDATQVVFHVLSQHVDRGQVEKVRESMREDMRRLWSESALDDAPGREASGCGQYESTDGRSSEPSKLCARIRVQRPAREDCSIRPPSH
ncbi:DUF2267 domain-containing protein [Sinorhizobium meliloti]|uniref:DUF2267 domain-containing protein n=1 Tax=Rhizobium meliloti TaxID=382 RepID=UPI000D1DEB05|nr:DUF2267 domain-containing protein [Sinorhizobium meliloti]QND28240.1 DUF2267 domain-containing protein [Sinorhizobium meliloti]RMI18598.1 DUF2267 domain-containing protein [Sinorhizobium meliloti]RVH94450.1 DUF2267 domain-containing protein [Sinorhizobium meliloti]RVK31892.1 DUF2267 domain-containing protein [Sinorhizobium meliloti]RVK88235.1 DUF2267 domain-containing protein [Sinorhizobium meliloti]